MTNYDVIKKLIGPITPVGETHTDEIRYEHLMETIYVVESLIMDIRAVSLSADRPEHSMAKAGQHAAAFLAEIKCS